MNELGKIELMTDEHIKTLSSAGIIPANTPPAQVALFAQICKEKGISPFQKHIYLLAYKSKSGTKYQVIMGIDGFRHIASMSGVHAGTDITYNNGLTIDQCQQLKEYPRTAKCIVKKVVHGVIAEFSHEVSMNEFIKVEKYPTKWQTMPFQMLGKCAEAFALKKAFPEHLSGLHVPEEKAAFENTTIQADAVEVDSDKLYEDAAEKVAQYSDSEKLKNDAAGIVDKAIKNQMDQMDIEKLKQFIKECYAQLKKNSDNE